MLIQKPALRYIGRKITIKSLKDFILDNHLTENDIVLLNPTNFDDVVIEYRETYREGITDLRFLLNVLIQEDNSEQVPLNRVGFIKNDDKKLEKGYDT